MEKKKQSWIYFDAEAFSESFFAGLPKKKKKGKC